MHDNEAPAAKTRKDEQWLGERWGHVQVTRSNEGEMKVKM